MSVHSVGWKGLSFIKSLTGFPTISPFASLGVIYASGSHERAALVSTWYTGIDTACSFWGKAERGVWLSTDTVKKPEAELLQPLQISLSCKD